MIILEGIQIDELELYRGKDIVIADGIVIHQPSLDEICSYGEQAYWSMIHTLTAVGADLKFQLFDIGIDYTQISDYELFCTVLRNEFSQKQTAILFGSLDLPGLQPGFRSLDGLILYDPEKGIILDEYTYLVMVNTLRAIHGLKRNSQLPANEATKQILIEDAREEFARSKTKEYQSQLKNLISAMINSAGFKYSHSEVWNMKIHVFLDCVKRISKIKQTELLLQSGYSGFGINLGKIPAKQLDWLGRLD